jgi:tRNA A37 threonylcarbamoyltransferase TsaD
MTETDVTIIAIESSCDETSVAVVKNGNTVLSNVVASQIKSHMRFGGVVPEVASRHHVEQITQIVEAALHEAQVTFDAIDAVAVTHGPGFGRLVADRRQCSEGVWLLRIRNRSFRSIIWPAIFMRTSW